MTPQQLIWEASKYTVFCTEEEFYASIAGSDIRGYYREGRLIGAVTYDGPEFHFVMAGGYTVKRADVIEVLKPLIDRYGMVKTKTPREDKRQQRFNERFGFVRSGEDDETIHYTYIPVSRA